ncbi:hypothetical protein SeMB42_g04291 [Synchytrium endobioticum]|uniref:CCHC-type domain-containing protein n=1 Tax=Synchytrium endobioticum TaxID=286115 RepID=A0A507CZE3_9FUNG|nr:hypothetical protein SeMB42_g04291 [Synchytrium endobioticum]TPX47319.1 hypothetical protein SeLEV6574_g02727 [Synchytrium endobioticum]
MGVGAPDSVDVSSSSIAPPGTTNPVPIPLPSSARNNPALAAAIQNINASLKHSSAPPAPRQSRFAPISSAPNEMYPMRALPPAPLPVPPLSSNISAHLLPPPPLPVVTQQASSIPGIGSVALPSSLQERKYFELPAGLMVPLVKPPDPPYTPIKSLLVRIPPGPRPPPSKELLAAVGDFYAGLEKQKAFLQKQRQRDGFEEDPEFLGQAVVPDDFEPDGWEKGYLDFWYSERAENAELYSSRLADRVHRNQDYERTNSSSDKKLDEPRGRKRSASVPSSDSKTSRSTSYSRSRSRSRSRDRRRKRSSSGSRSRSRDRHRRSSRSRSRSYDRRGRGRDSKRRRSSSSSSDSSRKSYSPSRSRTPSRSRSCSRSPSPHRSRGYSREPQGSGSHNQPSREFASVRGAGSMPLIPVAQPSTMQPLPPQVEYGARMLTKMGLPGLANALPTLNVVTPETTGLGAGLGGGGTGRGGDIFEQYRRGKSSLYSTMEKAAKVTGCFRCGRDGHIAKNCPN